jgi:hypothetical protein
MALSRLLWLSIFAAVFPLTASASIWKVSIFGSIPNTGEVITGSMTLSDEVVNPSKFSLKIGGKILCEGFLLHTFTGSIACSDGRAAEFKATSDGTRVAGKGLIGGQSFTIEFDVLPSSINGLEKKPD